MSLALLQENRHLFKNLFDSLVVMSTKNINIQRVIVIFGLLPDDIVPVLYKSFEISNETLLARQPEMSAILGGAMNNTFSKENNL